MHVTWFRPVHPALTAKAMAAKKKIRESSSQEHKELMLVREVGSQRLSECLKSPKKVTWALENMDHGKDH